MYKNIALIALLLPFSGAAQTKQERIKEIELTIDRLNEQQEVVLVGFMCGFPLNLLTESTDEVAALKKILEKYIEQIDALNEEYTKLNNSLEQ